MEPEHICQDSWGLGPVPGHWHREQPLLLGEPLLKVPRGFPNPCSRNKGRDHLLDLHLSPSPVSGPQPPCVICVMELRTWSERQTGKGRWLREGPLPRSPLSTPWASLLFPGCSAVIFLSLLSPTGLCCPEQPLSTHPSSWLWGSASVSQGNLPALGLQGDGLSCQRRAGFRKGSEPQALQY